MPYMETVNMTTYPNRPSPATSPSCVKDLNLTVNKQVWYQFTPTTDGVLTVFSIDFVERFVPPSGVDASLAAFVGSCSNRTALKCVDDEEGTAFNVLHTVVQAGLTYYVQVADVSNVGTGLVNVTFDFKPYEIDVAGDECTNAKVISHSALPLHEMVDTRLYTLNPNDVVQRCESDSKDGFSLWYKYEAPMDGLLTFDTSGSFIDIPQQQGRLFFFRLREVDISLSASVGECNSQRTFICTDEGSFETMYVPVEKGETYTIKVAPAFLPLEAVGFLNIKVSFQPNFFLLRRDGRRVALLNDIYNGRANDDLSIKLNTLSYALISSPKLGLEAFFPNLNSTRSVRLQLGSQRKSVCEQTEPYVMNGTVGQANIPFPLGKHIVTATAYSSSNCAGSVLDSVSQEFIVKGCASLHYELYDASRDIYLTSVNNASIVSAPPCQVNLGVSFSCGFTPDKVRLELRKASNNALVASRNEVASPYLLFGDNGKGNIYSGNISAGEYVLTAIINNIVHPSVRFTMGTCEARNALDSTFDIDLRFDNFVTSPSLFFSEYETAKLFQPIVNRISSLIIGDRPDVTNTTEFTSFFNYCGGAPSRIDDLYICAALFDYWQGEAGILGFVNDEFKRTSDNLTVSVTMGFDETTFKRLLQNGDAENYILQQLIQALGLGASWSEFGLAERSSPCSYSGAKAKAEFAAITGCSSNIPLDQETIPLLDGFGDIAADCRFWDPNCLKNEVLTLTLGEKKISRITLGALEDLGYVVNYTAADPYTMDDIGTCSGCHRRNLKSVEDTNDARQRSKTSSCHSGLVHERAIRHGRKILGDVHERYLMHAKGQQHEYQLGELTYVGNQRITVMYEHEDGTLCSVNVVNDDLF